MLATCPLPWRADERWDRGLFRESVRHLARALTRDLYIFGTAGEGYAVTERQFRQISRVFVEELKALGGTPMIGLIHLSLPVMRERLAFLRDLGVQAVQISLPSWGALDDVELERFFAAVCDGFPQLRFLHYNLARARRVLTGVEYAKLATRHPNLVAIKMGGENLDPLREIARHAPMLRCFFTEFGFIPLADETDCGLLCALSVCDPDRGRQLFAGTAAARQGLEPFFRGIHAGVKGALAGRAHMDGAYDKMYVKLHLPDFPLRLLPPYSGASEAQFETFQRTVRELRVSPVNPLPV